MKRRILITSIIIIVVMAVPLIMLIDKNNYTEKIETDLLLICGDCNNRQNDMSNYVIEHYNDIQNYCETVIREFETLTQTDKFGRFVMEQSTHENLLNEYNLSYFCNLGYVEFYDNKILFVFDNIDFDNGYYAYFSFTFEDNAVKIQPYVYDLLNKDDY